VGHYFGIQIGVRPRRFLEKALPKKLDLIVLAEENDRFYQKARHLSAWLSVEGELIPIYVTTLRPTLKKAMFLLFLESVRPQRFRPVIALR